MKQQQLLQAYVATTLEAVTEEPTNSPNEVLEEKGEIEEFRDTPLQILNANLTDYVYEEGSGEMTDEDYY